MRNKAIACLGAIVACATALAGIPATAMADDSAGLSTTGNGDRGQSYSYAAASSGDWVYIGTMYGASACRPF